MKENTGEIDWASAYLGPTLYFLLSKLLGQLKTIKMRLLYQTPQRSMASGPLGGDGTSLI